MTTASVLVTVNTTWGTGNDKCEKDALILGRSIRNMAAVAAKELRESPATREQALRIMREWIHQNQDIKNVREDDAFLLRFLRHKKYSIPMAQQTLLKYLNLRKFYPECFSNLDSEEPKMEEILNNGYIAVSPVRDSEGRRVIIYNIGKINMNKFTCWDMCRAHVLVYECLMDDPMDQIFGFNHVGDGSGVTASFVTAWNPTDFARLLKWGEQSLPMRHKACHMTNVPTSLKYVIDFGVSKLSSKMAQRLHTHTSAKHLVNNVDSACLPTTFGGQIPFEEMIEYTRQLLKEQKKKLMRLDEMEILSTRGIISSRKSNDNGKLDSVQGSFRKLEID